MAVFANQVTYAITSNTYSVCSFNLYSKRLIYIACMHYIEMPQEVIFCSTKTLILLDLVILYG